MVLRLIFCAILFANFYARGQIDVGPFGSNQRCSFRKNITGKMIIGKSSTKKRSFSDVQTIAHHQYMILEDCLYYDLAAKADKAQGKGQALHQLPPTRYGKQTDNVKMNIYKTSIRQLWMARIIERMR